MKAAAARRPGSRRGVHVAVTTALTLAVLTAGCGSNDVVDSSANPGTDVAAELPTTGYRRTPLPEVGSLALPDLAHDGAPFALSAPPGGLLLIYFGYTNCPDFCPATWSYVRSAEQRLAVDDPTAPDKIIEAMISVDPARDAAGITDYIGAFFPDGHALLSDDPAALARVAAPFGVGYTITPADESETGEIEVAHTTSLYAVNDRGQVVLTWQFGVSIDDLTADLEFLLDESAKAISVPGE